MNLDRLITETLRRQLLVENVINNSWRAARKMVIDRFRYTKEEAEKMVNEISILVGISYEMVKFIKGCTRMFLNGELNDQRVLGDFKDVLNKIKTDGHIGQFDSDLRRLDQPEGTVNSAKDVISIFKPEIDRERAEQRQKLSGMTFEENTDYEIVKIDSFEEASEYSRYTSWCVTSGRTNYDSYTGKGINQFYFCLQNGFENIKDNGNFDDKKDTYALSMLAILVNPEGELIHCTNRKNNDQSTLNPFEISNLLGCNFYETFKPNTTWRDILEDVKNKLANGVHVECVFDEVRRDGDLFIVRVLERWNVLGKGNTFLCDRWYDSVHYFSEGFAVVEDDNKGYNFINREGKEICDRWYDDVLDFFEGFARVQNFKKGFNFINREGKEICDRWYNYIGYFKNGFAVVEDKTKGCNFINCEGKEISDRLYDGVRDFSEGFARVSDKTKGWNFINREGKEICDRWYERAWDFHEGFALVRDENKGCNFINREGKEICERWYERAWDFHEGFAMVADETKGYNLINCDGKEISDRWYDYVGWFSEGFADVNYKGKYYRLRKDGVLCDYKTKKPIEDSPTQMAESLINRLVSGILFENKLKKKGKNKITPLNSR